jgi:uncharacterized protein (DUF924 family)
MTQIEKILDFWFGEIKDGLTTEDRNKFWFMPNAGVDNTIRDKFEALVTQAGSGELKSWESTPRGSLALIILLDQFTRNIYRGKPEAFQYDSKALRICDEGINKGWDKKLEIIERCFFYLPLEHSENLEDQNRCVRLYEELLVTVDKNKLSVIKNSLDYAVLHRDIIEEFGRFPHRNKILNRESTNKELDFLLKQGIKFGQ